VPFPTVLRTVATARIVLPKTIIRLAAGRQMLSEPEQTMCFMAGANAVFTGEQMLTTPCELSLLACVGVTCKADPSAKAPLGMRYVGLGNIGG